MRFLCPAPQGSEDLTCVQQPEKLASRTRVHPGRFYTTPWLALCCSGPVMSKPGKKKFTKASSAQWDAVLPKDFSLGDSVPWLACPAKYLKQPTSCVGLLHLVYTGGQIHAFLGIYLRPTLCQYTARRLSTHDSCS